jgi:hypothetical protein
MCPFAAPEARRFNVGAPGTYKGLAAAWLFRDESNSAATIVERQSVLKFPAITALLKVQAFDGFDRCFEDLQTGKPFIVCFNDGPWSTAG